MSKSSSHKQAQRNAAGRGGKTEVKIKGTNKLLDAVTMSGKKATEVERSGTTAGFEKAAQRLKMRRSQQKVLQVPQPDMSKTTSYAEKESARHC